MYILKNENKYIGIDQNSGGYPVELNNFIGCKIWTDIKEVEAYQKHFPEYLIYKIRVIEYKEYKRFLRTN